MNKHAIFKLVLIHLFLVLALLDLKAESFLYFQNNTSYNVTVSTSATLSSSYWVNSFSGVAEAWRLKTKIFEVNRDQGITNGVDFYLTTKIKFNGDSVYLKTKLNGNFVGSDIWCSASGTGFSHPWYDDYNFHSQTITVGGKQFILKYQFDLPPGNAYADMYYVLQEVAPYPVNTSELANAHILNILSYNIYMLTPPIGSSEEIQRAAILHNYIHNYDVVVLNEAFYNTARDSELIPNLSTEYPYHSAVVDQSGATEDGGVIIFSRYPILQEVQTNYTDCNGTDCLSAKGVMYIKINKLGVPYHIFGTHTQAWNDPADVSVRLGQLQEMYNFMLAQNIPADEAVIFAGDMNVNKANPNWSIEYTPMLNILHAAEPQYIGHPYTWDGVYNNYANGPEREYLDYVFCDTTHYTAAVSTNKAMILRHAESNDNFWDNNSLDLDLSDHYPVHGRFEFPFFNQLASSTFVCANDSFELFASFSHACTYQWFKDGQAISGATDSILHTATNANASYYCVADYGISSLQSATISISLYAAPSTPNISQIGNNLTVNTTDAIQWYNANGPIIGETNAVLSTCDSGTYYVVVQNANGCNSEASNSIHLNGFNQAPIITLVNDTLFSNYTSGNQWYNSNGLIQGATESYFTSCDPDNYYSIVTNGTCTTPVSNTLYLDNSVDTPSVQNTNGILTSSAANGNQWYDANGLIVGANAQSYTPTVSGSYYVIVSDGNCSSVASANQEVLISGIQAVIDENAFFVLRENPIEDKTIRFELKHLTNDDNISLTLFNSIGRLVYQSDAFLGNGQHAILLSNYAAGFYYLSFSFNNSNINKLVYVK